MDTQAITTLDQVIANPKLTPEQRQILQSPQSSIEEVRNILYKIELPEANIDAVLYRYVTDSHPAATQEATPEETHQETNSHAGQTHSMSHAYLAASIPLMFVKKAKEEEIANSFDADKLDEVERSLDEILTEKEVPETPQALTEPIDKKAEKIQKISSLLQSLYREQLYDDRTSKLLEMLAKTDPKKAEDLTRQIQLRHQELRNQRQNPEQTSMPHITTKESYERFLTHLQKDVFPGMTDDEMRAFVKKFASIQLRGTHKDFRRLFFNDIQKRLLPFLPIQQRQKRILSVGLQNKVFKKISKERAARRKQQKPVVQKRRTSPRQFFIQQFFPLPLDSEDTAIYSDDDRNQFSAVNTINNFYNHASNIYNTIKNVQKIQKFLKAVSSAIKLGEGAGAAVAGWPIWVALLVLLILVFVGVGVWLAINNYGTASANPGGTAVSQCQSQDPTSVQGMEDILNNQFNISVVGSNNTVATDIYHTVCKLSAYKFLSLAGVPSQKITFTITSENSCKENYNVSNPSNRLINVYPCGSSSGNEFLITHELAHLIEWTNPQVYDSFCTQVFGGTVNTSKPINNGRCTSKNGQTIPTYNCLYDYINNQKVMGPPPWAVECFSDMAGSFFTYKDFSDTVGALPTGNSKMQDYPNNFPAYYNFANNYLFATTNGDILTWADTIDKRLSKGGGTNWDQFTPTANQDTTSCSLTVDPITGNFKDTEDPGPQCPILYRAYKAGDLMYTVRRRGIPGRTDPSNKLRYWCTDFVIDVFNLAAGQRILGENLGMVVYMQRFFAQQSNNPGSGLGFLNYNADHHVLSQVKPGAAIFFLQNNDGLPHDTEHTGIVTSITIDNNGNGSIHTDEANNMGATPQYVYPVSNWNVENAPYPVRGFGFLK